VRLQKVPYEARRARAVAVARTLREAGHLALLCGGAVRDELLGREPADYDVATSAPPEVGAPLFPHAVLVGARFGVLLVPHEDGDVEVATFRDDGLYVDGRRPEEVRYSDPVRDAQRRDFTVNGIFLDPFTGEVHDYVEGRRDLKARLLRAIGDPEARFREDLLRILRAVRLAAQLGFAIEPRTREAVGDLAPRVAEVSAERVRDELVKLLARGRGRGLRLLRELGLLRVVLPEIEAMAGVAQPPRYHPEGDVFVHTCLALDGLALEDDDPEARQDLLLATLLHDIAKPPTFSRDDDGRIRFNGHDALGAEMSEAVLLRLRLPGRTIERVQSLVGQHMRIAATPHMRKPKLRRFLADPDLPLHLALHAADSGASHGSREILDFCRAQVAALGDEPALPPPLLRGADLLALGYPQGPRIGEMLRRVQEEQLEGALTDRDGAVRRVRELFGAPPSDPGTAREA
jgi:poly(A) polymerase